MRYGLCEGVEGGAVVDAELGEDVLDVVVDGALGDVQPGGDLPVGQARTHEAGDLLLSPGQESERRALGVGGHDRGLHRPAQLQQTSCPLPGSESATVPSVVGERRGR